MSRIVTDLRTTRADMLGTEDEAHYWVCHEAANYIEQLHDEIATLNELAKLRYCDMQTEIERLRAALVAIRDHPEEDGVADSMEAIARTALERDDE